MTWFKCIFTNIFTGENDQNLYVSKRGSGTHSMYLLRGNLYQLPTNSSALILGFLVLQIFFQFQNVGTPRSVLSVIHYPSLFQRRRWVSLWMHSSTVTRSTSRLSTGEWWDCVEVNTVCCCWLYWYTGKACIILPLPKQLAPCGLHHPIAATNYTVTPVNQF